MDALKKYKIAKQCYFQIGGAGCKPVEGVGTYYNEYLCKEEKNASRESSRYDYIDCNSATVAWEKEEEKKMFIFVENQYCIWEIKKIYERLTI